MGRPSARRAARASSRPSVSRRSSSCSRRKRWMSSQVPMSPKTTNDSSMVSSCPPWMRGLVRNEGVALVEGPPPLGGEVVDRHDDGEQHAGDGRPDDRASDVAPGAPQGQVPEEEGEQQGGEGQAGVPGPPHAPRRAAPDGAGRQAEGAEDHTDLGGRTGHEVPPPAPRPGDEVQDAGQGGHPEGHERPRSTRPGGCRSGGPGPPGRRREASRTETEDDDGRRRRPGRPVREPGWFGYRYRCSCFLQQGPEGQDVRP